MKRSIQSLVNNMSFSKKGLLKGGFGSLKGGLALLPSVNDKCTNSGSSCNGSNVNGCTNEKDCYGTTNSHGTCTNSLVCFA